MGAVALLCLLGACSDEGGVTQPNSRGVVNLRLTRNTSGPENEYEHVNTLRIIIADHQSNTIYYNNLYEDIEQDESTWTETFHDLPATPSGTPYDFYAIANEGSFLSEGESLEGKTANILSLINDYTLEKREFSLEEYIPQTAKRTEEVSSVDDAENAVTLPLQYAVAKVNLTFVNASGEEQSVSDISISGIKGDSAPLFAPETVAARGGDLSFKNAKVSAGESSVQTAYVYETASSDGYTLTATYKDETKKLPLGNLTEIPRGMQVNITVTLQSEAKVSLVYVLQPWEQGGGEHTFN